MSGELHAHVGDWLVVKAATLSRPERRGEIVAVGEGGAPPFTVRWTSDDHEAIVFPGPDARVLTSAELADRSLTGTIRFGDVAGRRRGS